MLTESEIKKTMQYYYLIHIALIVVLLTATTESRARQRKIEYIYHTFRAHKGHNIRHCGESKSYMP